MMIICENTIYKRKGEFLSWYAHKGGYYFRDNLTLNIIRFTKSKSMITTSGYFFKL